MSSVNADLVKEEIRKKGLKVKSVADLMGMSRQNFDQQLNKDELTLDFIVKFRKNVGEWIDNLDVKIETIDIDEKNTPKVVPEVKKDALSLQPPINQGDDNMMTILRSQSEAALLNAKNYERLISMLQEERKKSALQDDVEAPPKKASGM